MGAASGRPARSIRWLGLAAAVALVLAACGGAGDRSGGGDAPAARIWRVPADVPSIQGAVDRARPGDLVLVAPGTYRESVTIETDGIVLRGEDRDGVVLDGEGRRQNGVAVYSDRVAVENLTVRDHQINGVLIAGDYGRNAGHPRGFRISHVTAVRNGLYGLYAFGARAGVIEASFASGSPDSGIYVGQCDPCEIVVRGNVAERNAIGYEATNASGVDVVENTWRSNRVGMTTSSGTQERAAPQHGGRIVANLVADNGEAATPETQGGFGVGIVLGGGRDNEVRRNRIVGNPVAGILLLDQDGYAPEGNRIEANTVEGNGVDLMVAGVSSAWPPAGNCAGGNVASSGAPATSSPAGIEAAWPCEGRSAVAEVVVPPARFPIAPPGISPRDVADPAPQPSMTGDLRRWRAPSGRAPTLEVDALEVPSN